MCACGRGVEEDHSAKGGLDYSVHPAGSGPQYCSGGWWGMGVVEDHSATRRSGLQHASCRGLDHSTESQGSGPRHCRESDGPRHCNSMTTVLGGGEGEGSDGPQHCRGLDHSTVGGLMDLSNAGVWTTVLWGGGGSDGFQHGRSLVYSTVGGSDGPQH